MTRVYLKGTEYITLYYAMTKTINAGFDGQQCMSWNGIENVDFREFESKTFKKMFTGTV